MFAVLLILVSTAGQRIYAAETDKGEGPDPDAYEITSAGETEDTETAAEEAGEEEAGPVTQQAGSYIVEAESTDNFRYESGHLYIYGGTVSVTTRRDVEFSTDRIEVSGYSVLVLAGVRIKAENGSAIRILPGADAEIRLSAPEQDRELKEEENSLSQQNGNYVEGAAGYAAIEAGTLPRSDASKALLSSLRITGGGSLTAVGGQGAAAIGGSRGQNACGIIVIKAGNIKAVGGTNADGIGCGAGSAKGPEFAPVVSEHVNSLIAIADGAGRPVAVSGSSETASSSDAGEEASEVEASEAKEAADLEENGAARVTESSASLIKATFAEPGDGSLAGLENVRVRGTNGQFEAAFDMPEGYRSFAIKVEADSDYMVEQGGRSFANAGEEGFSGVIEESSEADILLRGSKDANAEPVYLAPVLKSPAIDVEVTGRWEDEENRNGTRPGSVVVTLYANGKETGRTITLCEENEWNGTFDELPLYSDCVRQSYSIVEGRLEGYTGLISGSDDEGYTITNAHEPLPEGRSSEEEIALRSQPVQEGVIVAKVLTTKVSRTTPVRTSTTIKKSRSAKTADSSGSTRIWGVMLLAAAAALYIWIRFEQSREE